MIDLRSDTVTKPSPRMRQAMAQAEVGDDVMREDPTIHLLEKQAAEITGKEAALFTPSGTFANQLAIFTWAAPGNEIYLSENSHIVQHEAGASAHISGTFSRTITPRQFYWTSWEEIKSRIRPPGNIHFPQAGLICLENALSNGTIQPLDGSTGMRAIKKGAEEHNLPLHLDGARIFNAAAALKVPASEIAKHCDSLMFCLSKGLGAPVGSILCGPRDFIEKALYKRKIMGGGMRQAGILAAAGITALSNEVPRLHEDHEKAQLLCQAFSSLPLFKIVEGPPQINMVFVRLQPDTATNRDRFMNHLQENGIITYEPEGGVFRFVTHRDVSFEQIEKVASSLVRIAGKLEV